ncbi:MAG: TrkH family potassium uptake protein [Erysipelotrichaceae bacterium]|nr:TrkH family potassium uptake protein [Erysipelotrichaceae bacterium]
MTARKYYRLIAYYLSIFVVMIGVIQLMPLTGLIFYPEEAHYAYCFLIPGIIAIIVGKLLQVTFKDAEILKLEKHYDAVLVVTVWMIAILVSTVPWMLKGDYNFTQAAFEMTSGFSTTGLSVVDVDNTPHIFLMFRTISLFVGGVGLVLILTCAFSDRYGLNLYNAEGHNDRLMPNLARSARLILTIYSAYILFGSIAYMICGMPLFDALNTSVAAISTGGFSVIGESIYGYHSLGVEIVSIILMMLGQTNFFLHLSLFRRKFGNIIHHCEIKFFVTVMCVSMPFMIVNLLKMSYASTFAESLRITVFQFVSCITTTGFISVKDLAVLPSGFATFMILLMLFGGELESTGGGIKQYRVILAIKGIYYSIKNTVSNHRMVRANFIERMGRREVLRDEDIASTTSYIMFYMILFFTGSLIFTLYGHSLQNAMFEFASAISTVGLSVGITVYDAPAVILWTAIIGMFLGRLEIMVIFEAFLRVFKDAKGKEHI